MEDTEDTVEDLADVLEEKGDQQSLKQKPLLTPRLILTCCMEDIMDILMVDTTGENELPQQQNIKKKRYCKILGMR